MGKTKLGSKGKAHVEEQMNRFDRGKLLRTRAGDKLDIHNPEDRKQALAIFYREGEQGEKKGFAQRTYKGSTRERPKK